MTKKSKETFDYQTKRWGIKPIKNLITDFQGLELGFFKKDIPPHFSQADLSVLDLGCGGGNIDGYLKKIYPAWKITGIDISSNSLKVANRTFPDVKFIEASADNLPFKNNSFDLVVGFDTLEHFVNLEKVLSEVGRVLKKGGYFYVAIPLEKQFPTLYWLMYKMGWRGKKEFAGHVNFFDNDELISFFEKNGFGYVKHHFSNHILFSLADIPYYLMQSFRGQEAVSFESKIYEDRLNSEKSALGLFKKIVSGITFFESYIFRSFSGGKGHYLFRKKGGNDFFSGNPPLTIFEDWQIKVGLKKYLRPKDFAIKKHLDKINFKNAKKILDYGCADGVWLERILKETGSEGFGVDVSPDLIDIANSRTDRRGKYFDSSRIWPVKGHSIDFCFSFDVIEHLRNRQVEIEKLSKSIKKGGKILIFTLNPKNKFTIDWLFETLGSDWLYKRSDHLKSRFISPENLSRELTNNGFTKVGFELYPGPLNLFLDVFCYAYLKMAEKIFAEKSERILDLNDHLVKSVYNLNLRLDKIVNARGYSNGYFLWAEKK